MSGDKRKRSNTPSRETLEVEAQVVQLRRARMPFAQIAAKVGYANASAAQRTYRRAMNRIVTGPVEEMRREELDVIDRLHTAFWVPALNGDVKAGRMILWCSEARRKMFGLDAALHVKAEISAETRDRIRELAEQIAALPAAPDDEPDGEPDAPAGQGA